jgi:peptidoglycan hydrolase-like protein with peptidoglycan-binding domain
MPRLIVLATGLVLLAAAPAAAQDTTTTPVPPVTVPPVTVPTETTPAPPPAPTPVSGTIKITPQKVGGSKATVLAGARWRVRGVVKPYVAGQTVRVRFYHGAHRLASKTVHVSSSPGGASGTFVVGFHTKRTGTVTVRASHLATDELKAITAHSKSVTVLATHLAPGAQGQAVRTLQHLLEGLHFAVNTTGVYDQRTGRGVLAFQKLTGLPRTSIAGRSTMRKLLSGAGHFNVRFRSQGKHVEANLSAQVIALINPHGKVYRVYPISSGKPSTPTVQGQFKVYMKSPGYNSEGMYYSSYFIRGYAIHGYDPSPAYAASHGCLRTWIPDAISIYDWVQVGDGVDVYP